MSAVNSTNSVSVVTRELRAFGTLQHTFTITKSGAGSGTASGSGSGFGTPSTTVTCGPTCASQSVNFNPPTNYTLTATASAGSVFTGWSGDAGCSGGSFIAQTDTNCIANFNIAAPAVTAINPTSGVNNADVTLTSVTGANFQNNAAVKLTRTGQADIVCTGVSFTNATTLSGGTCPLTSAAVGTWNVVVTNPDAQFGMLANGFTVTAPPTYTLTIAKSGTGAGTVASAPAGINCGATCSANFNGGTSVTLTATPNIGSIFGGWSGDADCTDGIITMDANKSCTAIFTPPASASYTVISTGNEFAGWAWGSHVLGWLSFSHLNCDTNGNGVMDVNDTSAPAGCPQKDGVTIIPKYKVWIAGTLPNAPPVASNLQSTFLNRCSADTPFTQRLSFDYSDSEGDPMAQYTINVYDYACDANKNQFTDISCGGDDTTTVLAPAFSFTQTYASPYNEYNPAPQERRGITYSYIGTELTWQNIYYFTVEVRDPDHLN